MKNSMRRWTLPAALAVLGLATACAPGAPEAEPGATPTTAPSELPGDNSPADLDAITAERWVDHVRLGRGLDPDGKVPDHMATDAFGADEEIWISMEVTDAPVGSRVRVNVRDPETRQTVWTEERPVEPGASHLGFSIDEGLAPGDYRAEVIIGDERVADRTFQVG
jgi:hypothetical protein